MLRLIIAAALLLTCGPQALAADAAPATARAAPAPSGARLVVEKDVVDIGDIVRGETATAVFELRNAGSEELKILNAKPG